MKEQADSSDRCASVPHRWLTRLSRFPAVAAAILILIHAGLLTFSAVRNSVTYDEHAHLPAGVAYWKYREFGIYNLSPPLLRMVAAWPVVLAGADTMPASAYRKHDPRDRHWAFALSFMRLNAARYHELFVFGRLAMIPVSCLGAWLVFHASRRLWGDAAGVGCCAVYSLEPNVLAHGSIVGTDLGSAVAALAAVILWQRFCEKPTTGRAFAASLGILAAMLCKFTLLLLWLALLLIAAWSLWTDRSRVRARQIGQGTLLTLLVTWLGVNLAYGYYRSFQPVREYHDDLQSASMISLRRHLPDWLPVPLPRQMVLGFDAQKYESELNYPAFLLGRTYRGNRWSYYPIALAVKLPLGLLALILLATVDAFRRSRLRTAFRSAAFPLVIAMVVLSAGMILLANVNIGIRYVLPAVLPSFVLLGRVWSHEAGRWTRRIATGCVVLLAIESLAVAPRFLTFFNAFAGGPSRGWTILSDSNFDWGQGLIDLKRWMDENRVGRIELMYFGRVDASVYGIDYELFTEHGKGAEADPPEYAAVSTYFLLGQYNRLATKTGPATDWVMLPYAAELRRKKPVAVVGSVFYVYRRQDVDAAIREAGKGPATRPTS